MTSIMEDFGDIAARLAQIEQEKKKEREAESESTAVESWRADAAPAPDADIWASVYGFTPTSADCII